MRFSALVAVANYPSDDRKLSLVYVHTRNLFYSSKDIDITVLNFSAKYNYSIDGINVITLHSYENENATYDILICHAPNIRNHYRFLEKYGDRFNKFVFFFHGHEVLMCNQVYPKPYSFAKNHYFKIFLGDIYDTLKLIIWRRYYPSVVNKSWYIFVSQWMLQQFEKWTKINRSALKNRYSITYNCIGRTFENAKYCIENKKEYDFITIRHNLDNSKYGIDIVNNLAKANTNYKFLVIGKGNFFNYFNKADNIVWLNMTLDHSSIIAYLQKSRCALMPTRTDAQGLMMCEIASIGMPLITSDIPVCHESLGDFKNVKMIRNDDMQSLSFLLEQLEKGLPYQKNDKYYNHYTSGSEINIMNYLYNEK